MASRVTNSANYDGGLGTVLEGLMSQGIFGLITSNVPKQAVFHFLKSKDTLRDFPRDMVNH